MCRIFQKSGSGPRNGEQYGAPFIDEEWDESVMVPKCEDDAIFYVGNEGNVQRNNLEQVCAFSVYFIWFSNGPLCTTQYVNPSHYFFLTHSTCTASICSSECIHLKLYSF